MSGVKAKLKYLANTFKIIKKGDYVECAISKKKIPLENLNYWNVELQEALLFTRRSKTWIPKNKINKLN
jgi:Uncharacterized protein conserved in bacteria